MTAEEKPKIIVLTVLVQEADGIEAKDANGKFYCFILYFLHSSYSSFST